MRLLNVNTLQLEDFIDDSTSPAYSILSHRWDTEEVLYRDIVSNTSGERNSEGWKKILGCCQQTILAGLSYTWVDTCCIDKSSSAELSEAINSMYTWYRRAYICYAYLSDVHQENHFCNSQWFTRGWTLQELLAPADVLFFDSAWKEIGFKTSMSAEISQRTGIDEWALRDGLNFDKYSIAERMSWAADRNTTRVEDEAYCLMGIFNVNMPLIYGEGRKAFFRLQEELLKRSDDASIFAYSATMNAGSGQEEGNGIVGLFAPSPKFFRGGNKFIPHRLIPYTRNPYYVHMNEEPNMIQSNALAFKLSGHLVEFNIPWFKLSGHDFPAGHSDEVISSNISRKFRDRLQLTRVTIGELRKCAQGTRDTHWAIALLHCRRRNAGAIGIVLRESNTQGIYVRHHSPSLIETESTAIPIACLTTQITTIYVEANSLRMAKWKPADPSMLREKFVFELKNQTNIRAINLDQFGYVLSATYFHESSRAEFPHIVFRFMYETRNRCLLQALTFNLYLHGGLKKRQADECSGWFRPTEMNTVTPLLSQRIPTDRGTTTCIALNDQYKLILRGQMQWKQEESYLYVDDLRKECLVTVSIVPTSEVTELG